MVGRQGLEPRTYALRSLPDHTAGARVSSVCSGFRLTRTPPEPARPVKKGPVPRVWKGPARASRDAPRCLSPSLPAVQPTRLPQGARGSAGQRRRAPTAPPSAALGDHVAGERRRHRYQHAPGTHGDTVTQAPGTSSPRRQPTSGHAASAANGTGGDDGMHVRRLTGSGQRIHRDENGARPARGEDQPTGQGRWPEGDGGRDLAGPCAAGSRRSSPTGATPRLPQDR